jgi:alkaline phosphatase
VLRRIRPAAGNHEYATGGAQGYFDYFGAAAGPRGRGYYSYELGAWHVVVLNANCKFVSCAAGSRQERWLRRDLAAHRRRCVLAYWHQPRFSSGPHGNTESVAPFWRALYAARAELVLNGHDHHYERFAPQTPAANGDARRGIREFVVGSGGRSVYPTLLPRANSRVRLLRFGVLELILRPGGYLWRFHAEGGAVLDRGTATCR